MTEPIVTTTLDSVDFDKDGKPDQATFSLLVHKGNSGEHDVYQLSGQYISSQTGQPIEIESGAHYKGLSVGDGRESVVIPINVFTDAPFYSDWGLPSFDGQTDALYFDALVDADGPSHAVVYGVFSMDGYNAENEYSIDTETQLIKHRVYNRNKPGHYESGVILDRNTRDLFLFDINGNGRDDLVFTTSYLSDDINAYDVNMVKSHSDPSPTHFAIIYDPDHSQLAKLSKIRNQ